MSPTSATSDPVSLLSRRPAKPSLKITPLITPHIALPPMDLTALVTASIRAQPSPRRNLPEFKMGGANPAPEAPPSTPTDDSFLFAFTPNSSGSTPRSEKKVRFDFSSSSDMASPRSSEESIRSVDSDEVAR